MNTKDLTKEHQNNDKDKLKPTLSSWFTVKLALGGVSDAPKILVYNEQRNMIAEILDKAAVQGLLREYGITATEKRYCKARVNELGQLRFGEPVEFENESF